MNSNISSYQLIVFYFVAKEKSMTLAAEKLFLTQPTVTNHIKSLERHVQAKLVETFNRKVRLTAIGEGLFQYAEQIYRQTRAAETYIEHAKQQSLNIGVCPFCVSIIGEALNNLAHKYANSFKLKMKAEDPFFMLQDLVDSKNDVVIVPGIDYGFKALKHIRIADALKIVFYASPSNPIFDKPFIEWQDIVECPLSIGPENYPLFKILSKKLIEQKIFVPINNTSVATNNPEISKIIVQNGEAIGIALERDLQKEIEQGNLRIISLPDDLSVDMDAVIRNESYTPDIVLDIINYARLSFEKEILENK
jgi:LysR family transcriptional regulator, transcriptional activator of the cysJI operon